jgi:hypothetical protein
MESLTIEIDEIDVGAPEPRGASTASIDITVAKQNITMQAIGMGDCTVSSLDNIGDPCKLVLQDVLHVPEAGKVLIFAYCKGYQVDLPSDNATFPPGVYCPRQARRPLKADSAQQRWCIPLQLVNFRSMVSIRF